MLKRTAVFLIAAAFALSSPALAAKGAPGGVPFENLQGQIDGNSADISALDEKIGANTHDIEDLQEQIDGHSEAGVGGRGIGVIMNAEGKKVADALAIAKIYNLQALISAKGMNGIILFRGADTVNGMSGGTLYYKSEGCAGAPFVETRTLLGGSAIMKEGVYVSERVPEERMTLLSRNSNGSCQNYSFHVPVAPARFMGTASELGLDRKPFRLIFAH